MAFPLPCPLRGRVPTIAQALPHFGAYGRPSPIPSSACIKRGGSLARGGAVVVKTAKPGQDTRFDMPAVGLTTLSSMEESGCAVLAIEAWHTLFAEKEAVIQEANKKGIVILAVEGKK